MPDTFQEAVDARLASDASRRTRRQEAFTPDPSYERLIRAAETDPSIPGRLHVGLAYAIYKKSRQEAVDDGSWSPPEES